MIIEQVLGLLGDFDVNSTNKWTLKDVYLQAKKLNAKTFVTPSMDDKLCNLLCIISNANKVKEHHLNSLTEQEQQDYFKELHYCKNHLVNLVNDVIVNINDYIKNLEKNKNDLSNKSKEELIEIINNLMKDSKHNQ